MKSRFSFPLFAVLLALSVSTVTLCADEDVDNRSAAYKRFRESKLRFETYNEFKTEVKYTEVTGIGFEKGVTRRDPSSVIKVGDLYYVWYTRPPTGIPVVGLVEAKAHPEKRAYHWDLAEIWYATSPDGYAWTERGRAVGTGPEGAFDHRSVFTADILVANGKYYLYYQAGGSLNQGSKPPDRVLGGDFRDNVIAMSWADSPNGPWHRWEKPILEVGPTDAWDGNVMHDPCLIVREGQYWLYYKSSPRTPFGLTKNDLDKKQGDSKEFGDMNRAIWGVAMADKPEGPYVKSIHNPVLISGHEVIVWPYRRGVGAWMSEGPERNSIQYAEDGINFYPVYHGITPPEAAGTFRAGNFTDTRVAPGQGITWGLSHVLGEWNFLRRFDCDLSVEKGDRINALYQKVKDWQQSPDK